MDEFLLKLLLCEGWEPGVCEGRVALDGGLQAGSHSQAAPETVLAGQRLGFHRCPAPRVAAFEFAPAV